MIYYRRCNYAGNNYSRSYIGDYSCTYCTQYGTRQEKEIYYKAVKKDPKIGAATVYRMVNTLEEIGAINRKNMYRITCDENDNGGYTVRLNDDSSINLSESKWSKIIESGLEACGYIKDQKITSVVDRKKAVSVK